MKYRDSCAGRAVAILAVLIVEATVAAQGAKDPNPVKTLNRSQSIALVKKYLAERDPAKKDVLLGEAGETPADDSAPFASLIVPRGSDPSMKKGVQHGLKLDLPVSVHDQPAEYSLFIPAQYTPSRPWPLLVGLHGGGENVGSGRQHMETSRDICSLDAIYVCPTSLNLKVTPYWLDDKNAAMLQILLRDLRQKLSIDPDRVYLCGYSMGGIGSYYFGAYMPDRFAAVAPGGGLWRGIFWEAMLNTPVYIWHGKNDNRGEIFTNFAYARNAAECLKELGYAHEFRAMDCGHSPIAPGEEKRMAAWLLSKKRDPYPKRIVTAHPRVISTSGSFLQDTPPDRWLSIDEIGSEKLEMEGVKLGGEPRMKHKVKMGTLDARWTAENTLDVKARNVRKFRVFLSPKIIDLRKPVRITVDGKVVHDEPVKTSLKFLMKYLDDRRDPGMIYAGAISVDLEAAGVK